MPQHLPKIYPKTDLFMPQHLPKNGSLYKKLHKPLLISSPPLLTFLKKEAPSSKKKFNLHPAVLLPCSNQFHSPLPTTIHTKQILLSPFV